MIEREYEQLIQDVLDGVATPEQVARLERWLPTSDTGRARRRELEGVFQVLRGVPQVEAPADLREQVLKSLHARAGRARAAPRGLLERLWSPRLRPAVVLAAGLAVVVIGYGALTGVLRRSGGWPPVAGSMMPSPAPTPGAGALRRSWSAGGSRVEAIAWQAGASRLAVFQVRSGEATLELDFDPQRLSPLEVIQPDGGTAQMSISPGRVVIARARRGEYRLELLELDPGDAPIRVTIRSGGSTTRGELPTSTATPPGGRP